MKEYTESQKEALSIIRAAKAIFNNESSHDLRIAAKIDEIQKNYPRASEVHFEIRNGQPFITYADSKIEEITGYAPEELKDNPLSIIMFDNFSPILMKQMIMELEDEGMCVKMNNNRRKDGGPIQTFGWIFKISDNVYREFVMKASHVLGYGAK